MGASHLYRGELLYTEAHFPQRASVPRRFESMHGVPFGAGSRPEQGPNLEWATQGPRIWQQAETPAFPRLTVEEVSPVSPAHNQNIVEIRRNLRYRVASAGAAKA